jgi:hypothetical protein
MWLTGRFIPDFKTIDDSRKDNGAAIQAGRHSPSRASRAGLAAVTAPPGAGTRTAIQIMTQANSAGRQPRRAARKSAAPKFT